MSLISQVVLAPWAEFEPATTRLVVVRHRGRRGEHGPAAHRIALKADIALVDEIETAQMGQPIRAAKAVGEGPSLKPCPVWSSASTT